MFRLGPKDGPKYTILGSILRDFDPKSLDFTSYSGPLEVNDVNYAPELYTFIRLICLVNSLVVLVKSLEL